MSGGSSPGAVAVVGHVEWVTHALGALPERGHIADLREALTEPAGGGGVAACAAARLGAAVTLYTAFGDDDCAREAARLLAARGMTVHGARRTGSQTPVLSISEEDGERTIMVIGGRLQPTVADDLPWDAIARGGAVYYAAEDPAVLALCRAAPALVVTARRVDDLRAAGVRADVLVASANDPAEDPGVLPPSLAPGAVVLTDGARGGIIREAGRPARPYAALPAPGPVIDSYGCGDSFAAGLTVGLARGLPLDDAVAMGARAGAACATWRGGLGSA